MARKLFNQSLSNYDTLKSRALQAIDTFVDLVYILNEEMAKELRSAIVKFYKLRYFHDFTNYVITIEDMIDITEHCLTNPVEKMQEIRAQFHSVIKNFQDIRHFETVDKCLMELPDEVAVAHCMLHQAVLFNETMQESLTKIVEIKTRQHAQDINITIYDVKNCFKDFVPDFYEQLLVDTYTETCGFLRILNASTTDLVNDKWRNNEETKFPKKWTPLLMLLKDKTSMRQSLQEPIILTLFAANLTSQDIVKTLYKD
ncbi:uncharacterized protein [Epargyreus clarus]|uniref:uncharacterized protein n=1 Tax=Epargyreus clarus TaxID=520877 RepID=UPI003C304EC0